MLFEKGNRHSSILFRISALGITVDKGNMAVSSCPGEEKGRERKIYRSKIPPYLTTFITDVRNNAGERAEREKAILDFKRSHFSSLELRRREWREVSAVKKPRTLQANQFKLWVGREREKDPQSVLLEAVDFLPYKAQTPTPPPKKNYTLNNFCKKKKKLTQNDFKLPLKPAILKSHNT